MQEFPNYDTIPEQIIVGDPKGEIFDLHNLEWKGQSIATPGRLVHRVISIMFIDLYSPLRLGSLFSLAFTNEFFNIDSSPNKVHQALHRAREVIAKNHIPLNIVELDGMFKPEYQKSIGLLIPFSKDLKSREELLIEELKTKNLPIIFSRSQVMDALQMPLSTTTRFINKTITLKLLEKVGSGSKTKYKFKISEIIKRSA